MNDRTRQHRIDRLINFGYFGIAVGIIFIILRFFVPWIWPFIIAFAVSLIIDPPVRFLNRRFNFPRGLTSIICILLFFAFVGSLVVLLVSRIAYEVNEIYAFTQSIDIQAIYDTLDRIEAFFSTPFENLPDFVETFLSQLYENVVGMLPSLALSVSQSTVRIVAGVAAALPNILIFLVVTVIATIFMSSSLPEIKEFAKRQLSDKNVRVVSDLKDFLGKILLGMIRSYATLMGLTFLELLLGFTLMRFEFALTLALLIAAIDIFPVLGVGTVLIPWAILNLLQGEYGLGIALAALYGIITAIRQYLEPRIVGSNIGLHPLLTLFAIYLGFKLMGLAGAFLLPVVFIVVVYMHRQGYIKIWRTAEDDAVAAEKAEPPLETDSVPSGC